MPPKKSQQKKKTPPQRQPKKVSRPSRTALFQSQMDRNRLMIPRSINMPRPNNDLQKYRLAMVNPFHPDASGVRCPTWCTPNTVPFRTAWSGRFTLPSGITVIALQPNPNIYGWASLINNGFPGTASLSGTLGPVSQVTGAATVGTTPGVPGILRDVAAQGNSTIIQPSVAQSYSNFRAVAGGCRIYSTQPTTSRAFECYATAIPLLAASTPYNILSGNGTTALNGVASQTNETQIMNQFYGFSPPIPAN